jgi:hypothetical protein
VRWRASRTASPNDPFQHPFVESPCESAGRIIIDGPPAATTAFTPIPMSAARYWQKGDWATPFRKRSGHRFREMAAVDEEQLQAGSFDLTGSES